MSLHVSINGEEAVLYKGKSRENLERVIQFRMQEAGMSGEVTVQENAEQPASSEVTG